MTRRATRPLNQDAIDCADQKFYELNSQDQTLFDEHGDGIPLDPYASKHAAYRSQWLDLYEACGGELEDTGSGKKKPDDPIQPCVEDELILVEVREVVMVNGKQKLRPVEDRKQYVNLDQQVEQGQEHPEYGRFVCLKARVEWQSGKSSDLAGHMVYWDCIETPPIRSPLSQSEQHSYDELGRAKRQTSNVTDAQGWTEIVEFYLSTYGGEPFELSAALDPSDSGLWAGTYTVWRKFWYQVTEMKRPDGGRFELSATAAAYFEAGYRDVFIHFEEKKINGKRSVAEYATNLSKAEKKAFNAQHFVHDDRVPFTAHVVMLERNELDEHKEKVWIEAVTTSEVWESEKRYGLAPKPLHSNRPWLISAEFRRPGAQRSWDIPKTRVYAIASDDDKNKLLWKLGVDFRQMLPNPKPDRPIDINLQVFVYTPFGIGGHSQSAYINLGVYGEHSAEVLHQGLGALVIHEVGHCLGLLNFPPAEKGDHDAWRDPKSGHCVEKTCHMYRIGASPGREFHFDDSTRTGCRDYLLRQDFSRTIMADFWAQ